MAYKIPKVTNPLTGLPFGEELTLEAKKQKLQEEAAKVETSSSVQSQSKPNALTTPQQDPFKAVSDKNKLDQKPEAFSGLDEWGKSREDVTFNKDKSVTITRRDAMTGESKVYNLSAKEYRGLEAEGQSGGLMTDQVRALRAERETAQKVREQYDDPKLREKIMRTKELENMPVQSAQDLPLLERQGAFNKNSIMTALNQGLKEGAVGAAGGAVVGLAATPIGSGVGAAVGGIGGFIKGSVSGFFNVQRQQNADAIANPKNYFTEGRKGIKSIIADVNNLRTSPAQAEENVASILRNIEQAKRRLKQEAARSSTGMSDNALRELADIANWEATQKQGLLFQLEQAKIDPDPSKIYPEDLSFLNDYEQ